MKKKIYYMFIALPVILTVASCKKYLEQPYTNGGITEDQVWSNPNWAKGILNNAYQNIHDRYNDIDGDGALLASASDEAVNSNPNSKVNFFTNGSWNPINPVDDIYADMYAGIRKANLFLENAQKSAIPATNATINRDSTIKRMRGEAFFLRALFHFELVKRYGAVILVTHVLDQNEPLDLPKNTYDECVARIVADCDSAIKGLPTWTQDYNNATDTKELGRATKISAMALKARMLLYAASPLNNTGNDITKWQAAADAAKAIIDLNRQTLLPQASYINIFNFTTNNFNNEVIFAVLGTGSATSNNNRNDIETNNAPVSYDGAKGRTDPTQDLVDAFEMKNGKLITDPTSGYDPTQPYLNRDPRLAYDINYNGLTFKSKPVETFVGGKDGLGLNVNATRTGYYLRKFLSESATWNQASNTTIRRPWVSFRYAEVLLNYAEALNEAQGPVPAVYTAVNQIRARVGMPALPAGLTQTQMRTRIQNERRVELCFEEHRFFDVRRWKLGETYFNKPVSGMRITKDPVTSALTYQTFQVENRIFQSKMYYYPFSQSVSSKAKNLKQNPGW